MINLNKKSRTRRDYLTMCAREESNFHDQNGHQALNLARLPIPPRAHLSSTNVSHRYCNIQTASQNESA